MTDLEILKIHSQRIFHIMEDYADVYDQIKAIKNLLRDVQGEIRIETVTINGAEHICKVDVAPISVNLFQEFDINSPHVDAKFLNLSRLFTAYLWCEKTGETEQLYDQLLQYEQLTHYPVTRCDKDDKDTLMIEASCIIDNYLIQGQVCNYKPTIVDKIQSTITSLF